MIKGSRENQKSRFLKRPIFSLTKVWGNWEKKSWNYETWIFEFIGKIFSDVNGKLSEILKLLRAVIKYKLLIWRFSNACFVCLWNSIVTRLRFVWLWVKNLRCLAVYNVGIRLGMMRVGNYGGSLRLSRLLLWLFIVLLRGALDDGVWRVGEHQFSSAKCPRSFHCGEHFPSSPFSQATIATKKTNVDQKNRHSHCCKIFHFFSRSAARAT